MVLGVERSFGSGFGRITKSDGDKGSPGLLLKCAGRRRHDGRKQDDRL